MQKATILKTIRCLLGHRWVNLAKDVPQPPQNGLVLSTSLHQCSRCGKREYKGMGYYG